MHNSKLLFSRTKQSFASTPLKKARYNACHEQWVDKYKPKSASDIIGQAANVDKLLKFVKARISGKLSGGPSQKAVLLSGPPGVGKTTAAHLVCEQLKLEAVDFNASDFRSKSMLQSTLANVLDCRIEHSSVCGSKRRQCCFIMDEVDGMSGNEDRGGIQELIKLITRKDVSRTVFIFICNDRQHAKIRSLANHCLDLRFTRPKHAQIKALALSILSREHEQESVVTSEWLDLLISGSGNDVRQVIHSLEMWCSGVSEESLGASPAAKKNVAINVFEACKKCFLPESSLSDRLDQFFTDYSLMPLMVHENHLHVRGTDLRTLATTSKMIAEGDIAANVLRSRSNWSLLPTLGMLSTALPSHTSGGHFSQMISFPQWLGKNSKFNRLKRACMSMVAHVRLRVFLNRNAFRLDLMDALLTKIIDSWLNSSLRNGGSVAVDLMVCYFLLKDDLNTMDELGLNGKSKLASLDSKMKAALTRKLNASRNRLPFSLSGGVPIAAASTDANMDFEQETIEEEDDGEVEDGEGVKADKMIKITKTSKKKIMAKVRSGTGKNKKSKN